MRRGRRAVRETQVLDVALLTNVSLVSAFVGVSAGLDDPQDLDAEPTVDLASQSIELTVGLVLDGVVKQTGDGLLLGASELKNERGNAQQMRDIGRV
jgi:hypothetical protein